MTTILENTQIAHVADLLRSLSASVWDLRQSAERLKADIEAGEYTEIGSGSKELTQARGLVSACQKLEVYLAELEAERDRGGAPQLDLDAAQLEIGRRLACLRADGGADTVPD